MKRLDARVAVVTGAASGVGRATANALAAKGCEVALVDIAEEPLAEAAAAQASARAVPSAFAWLDATRSHPGAAL